MKALFVHDHIFYRKGDDYYSPGGLPQEAWNRYLQNIDQLFVVSRGSLDNNKDNLTLSSRDNIHFDLLYQVKGGLDYYKFKKEIEAKLTEYIKQVNFVIIRVPSTIGYFAYEICQKLNKPYVTEVVGCAWDSSWNYGSLPIKLQAPLGLYRMKKMVKNSFASTYVTKLFLQKRYPSDSSITSYASNVQIPFTEDIVLSSHIDYLSSYDGERIFKIGIIGNLNVKYKGYDIAFKALRILKAKHPNFKFKFYLVGGGDTSYIKGLIIENELNDETEIIGRLKAGSEIFEFLDKLDLYIHPSKQEGLPRAVIEAMSRACPILASTVAGIPELLEERYLHEPGDYKKLANDLLTIAFDKEQRIQMAKENFKKSKDYCIDILEKKRILFFGEIVNHLKN